MKAKWSSAISSLAPVATVGINSAGGIVAAKSSSRSRTVSYEGSFIPPDYREHWGPAHQTNVRQRDMMAKNWYGYGHGQMRVISHTCIDV